MGLGLNQNALGDVRVVWVKWGALNVQWTHLSSLQGLPPCYRLEWDMKLLLRSQLVFFRSVLHAVVTS